MAVVLLVKSTDKRIDIQNVHNAVRIAIAQNSDLADKHANVTTTDGPSEKTADHEVGRLRHHR